MKQIAILVFIIVLVSYCTTTRGQSLPLEEIITHLIEVDEIASEKKWEDAIPKVQITNIFVTSNKGLYNFSNTSVHRYSFLLLKSNDSFLILNCNNFLNEYEIMINQFFNEVKDSFNFYLPNIIQLYIDNQNYHKTPPMPILDTKELMQHEQNYPKRKIKNTSKFYYKSKE